MERHSVEAIFRALGAANVRYLVVGGLAVVAHGYVRFTADVDLIVNLEPTNVARTLTALKGLGYRPRAPVELAEFSLYSPGHPATEIDLFVEAPLDFGKAYEAAATLEVAPSVPVTFIGLPDLLDLKRRADRTQDRLDIEQLESLGRTADEGHES